MKHLDLRCDCAPPTFQISFSLEREPISHFQGEALGIQPICGYRASKQVSSPICIQSNCSQTLCKEFYQTRSVFKKNGCAKAQQTKPLLTPFAIVAKTPYTKVKPIRAFDKRRVCHLQPTVEDDMNTHHPTTTIDLGCI